MTTDNLKNTLDIRVADPGTYDPSQVEQPPTEEKIREVADENLAKQLLVEKIEALVKETQEDARQLAGALKKELSTGKVEIETQGRRIYYSGTRAGFVSVWFGPVATAIFASDGTSKRCAEGYLLAELQSKATPTASR